MLSCIFSVQFFSESAHIEVKVSDADFFLYIEMNFEISSLILNPLILINFMCTVNQIRNGLKWNLASNLLSPTMKLTVLMYYKQHKKCLKKGVNKVFVRDDKPKAVKYRPLKL